MKYKRLSNDPDFGSGLHPKVWSLLNPCGRFDQIVIGNTIIIQTVIIIHIIVVIMIIIIIVTIIIILIISLIRGQSSWWRSNLMRTIVSHWPHGLPTSDQVREIYLVVVVVVIVGCCCCYCWLLLLLLYYYC